MVSDVYEATRDESLLRRALPLLIKEHEYYTTGAKQVLVRAAGGPTADDGGGGDCAVHSLSRYWADLTQPRPESYREDLATAKAAETAGRGGEEARAQLFR